jgi:hypothetical protein
LTATATLDLGQFIEEGSRCIAQAAALHPLSQRLPKDVGQEAYQNMRLHAFVLVMPNGANGQFVFVDAKSPLGIGELHVAFPECARIDTNEIGPQQITALRQLGPSSPAVPARPGDGQARRFFLPLAWLGFDRRQHSNLHLERSGRTLVALQQPAEATVGDRRVAEATTLGRLAELVQSRFQSFQKSLVHRFFFFPPIGAARQHKGLRALWPGHQLDFDTVLHGVPVAFGQGTLELAEHPLGRADDVLATAVAQELQVFFADHAAVQHPDALRLAVLRFHGRDDIGDGFAVVGVACENFVTQRNAFLRDDQADAHLRAIRTTVARITALGLGIALALSFEVGAGDIVQEQVKGEIEQVPQPLLEMLLQGCLLGQEQIVSLVKPVGVHLGDRHAQ